MDSVRGVVEEQQLFALGLPEDFLFKEGFRNGHVGTYGLYAHHIYIYIAFLLSFPSLMCVGTCL